MGNALGPGPQPGLDEESTPAVRKRYLKGDRSWEAAAATCTRVLCIQLSTALTDCERTASSPALKHVGEPFYIQNTILTSPASDWTR